MCRHCLVQSRHLPHSTGHWSQCRSRSRDHPRSTGRRELCIGTGCCQFSLDCSGSRFSFHSHPGFVDGKARRVCFKVNSGSVSCSTFASCQLISKVVGRRSKQRSVVSRNSQFAEFCFEPCESLVLLIESQGQGRDFLHGRRQRLVHGWSTKAGSHLLTVSLAAIMSSLIVICARSSFCAAWTDSNRPIEFINSCLTSSRSVAAARSCAFSSPFSAASLSCPDRWCLSSWWHLSRVSRVVVNSVDNCVFVVVKFANASASSFSSCWFCSW